jgi:hypothetical protein
MIEEKEQYTFEELCEGLEISMSAFSKRANVDEGTILRLRRGHLARRGTINSLLRAFSEIYGIKFTLDNVTGLKKVEKPITPITEKPIEPSVTSPVVQPAKTVTDEKTEKRMYTRKQKDTGLPAGAISATDFARNHGVKRETFRDHQNTGLGPGLIHGPNVPEDGTVLVKDYVRSEERNKRVRKDGTIEKERYLTADQQRAALEFWRRHDVTFAECDQAECSCHSIKSLGTKTETRGKL